MEDAAVQKEAEREPWRHSRRGERLPDHCLDCGAVIQGPYCASCGQKNEPEHRSLWQLVKDAVGPAVLLESKLWRTLGTLLWRPGALAVAYTEGKRTRYIRPLRLYLWVSVLFFSALALMPADVRTLRLSKGGRVHVPFAPRLEKRLERKLEPFQDPADPGKVATRPQDAAGEGRAQVDARLRMELFSRLPKALFFLLPVFALLLRVLWWRRRPYVDHLVFALHAHTVLFLGLGVGLIPWPPFEVVGLVSPVVWFLVAVSRFYRSGWVETGLKAVLLAMVYSFLVVMVVFLTTMLAVLGT